MNKNIFTLLIFIVAFFSCSSDDNSNETKDIILFTEEMHQINGKTFEVELEPDNFIAEYAETGMITGVRVGKTQAIIKCDGIVCEYNITVVAQNTLYEEPIYLLGANKNKLIEIYGQPDILSEKYGQFSGLKDEMFNTFAFGDDQTVEIASIIYSNNYSYYIGKHIEERYKCIGAYGLSFLIFADNTKDKFNTVVLRSLNLHQTIELAYMSKATFEKRFDARFVDYIE